MVKGLVGVLIVGVLTACAPAPAPPTLPAVTPSAVAQGVIACEELSMPYSSPAVHLRCAAALDAAQAAVASQLPASEVTGIDFHYGAWCPPGASCGPSGNPNIGYVRFHDRAPNPDLVVLVSADESGAVTVTSVERLPN